jgi:hypothetical protein
VPGKVCAFVEHGFEENVFFRQLLLSNIPNVWVDLIPHVRDDDDVLQGAVTTQVAEHFEIAG